MKKISAQNIVVGDVIQHHVYGTLEVVGASDTVINGKPHRKVKADRHGVFNFRADTMIEVW